MTYETKNYRIDTYDSSDKSNDNNNDAKDDTHHLVGNAGDEHLDVYLGRAGFLAWIIMIVLINLMTALLMIVLLINLMINTKIVMIITNAGDEHLDVYLRRAGFLKLKITEEIPMLVLINLMTVVILTMLKIIITMQNITLITITLLAMHGMNILTSIWVGQDFWHGYS